MKRNIVYIVVFCIVLFICRRMSFTTQKTFNYMPYLKYFIVERNGDSIKISSVLKTGIDSDTWVMYKKGRDYYTKNLQGEDMVMSTSKEVDTTFHNGDFRYMCRLIIKKEGQLYSTYIYGTSMFTYLLMKLTYDEQYNIKSINPGIYGRVCKYE